MCRCSKTNGGRFNDFYTKEEDAVEKKLNLIIEFSSVTGISKSMNISFMFLKLLIATAFLIFPSFMFHVRPPIPAIWPGKILLNFTTYIYRF